MFTRSPPKAVTSSSGCSPSPPSSSPCAPRRCSNSSFAAPCPMLSGMAGGPHGRWGKVYFWAMAVVAATAIVLAVWKPVVFLALLAVFSFYSAFYGYRALSRKRPLDGQGAQPLDWAAAAVMLAASTAMAVLGTVRPSPAWERVGIVPVVFGVFGVVLAGLDFWRFGWPPADRHAGWFAPMRGMLGSHIATATAFSVVNFTFLPTAVRWLC